MESPHARWIPVFRLESLDSAGHEACQTLKADPRHAYFFRHGLGEAADELNLCIGLVDSLPSIATPSRHDPDRLWLLLSEDLFTAELRALAGPIILIPPMESFTPSECLIGFLRFVMELLRAADWVQFPVWRHLHQVLLEDGAHGVAIPSSHPAQALNPAFDGVAVVSRDGEETLKQVLLWSNELKELATTETRSLMVWGGHPAQPRMTLHLFPFLWNVQPIRSKA
jgi:hypothetical protein